VLGEKRDHFLGREKGPVGVKICAKSRKWKSSSKAYAEGILIRGFFVEKNALSAKVKGNLGEERK